MSGDLDSWFIDETDGVPQTNDMGNQSGGYNQNQSGGYKQPGNYNQNQGGGYNKGGGYSQSGYNKGSQGGFKPYQKKIQEGPTTLYKPYVGTGNSGAPESVLQTMRKIAIGLAAFGYTLRTGGMGEGPDDTFELANVKDLEVYVPWQGFNNKQSKFYFNDQQSKDVAAMFNPAFDGLKDSIKAFLAKNARMVLGKDLKQRAMFVLLWTEDGAETSRDVNMKTGNVGHVIRIASAMKIPVFNLAKSDCEERLKRFLDLKQDN